MGNCDNWRSTVVVVVIVVVAAVVEGHDDGVAGMVGVGATKAKLFQIGSHLSLSHLSLSAQFHMHYSITSHGHFLVFFKVFEAASAGKASSSLKKDFELPRSATVLLRIGLAACDWARSQKREVRANCVPLSLSLVGLKVVFC